MLALTQDAVDAVETIVTQAEASDDAVLRVSVAESTGNGSGPVRELQLALADEPEADDVVMDEVPLAVEPQTLPLLDDKVLDAEVAGGDVEFSLYMQPVPGSSNGHGPANGNGSLN